MLEANMKIVGHELRTVREKAEKGTVEEHDMLQVKLRGIGGDKATRAFIMVDPQHRRDFPMGENCTISFNVKQTSLELDGAEDGEAEVDETSGKARRRGARAAH